MTKSSSSLFGHQNLMKFNKLFSFIKAKYLSICAFFNQIHSDL
ncbi:hypothetical protein L313_1651 [Acinetobacter haemolyticus CIP 64.3 = MTCC 9819]|uniref:Uncharacterized protein n=1 Tax=Acinetobacter haemolyticus ATCC 19194 TaxID=707232 RepID=D4XP28_ACIHA|nr:hypothetical protein HMPREF0023_1395 [Acinetobacter sp. ATCC 27244]EFF83038.1 hypothetical protein HMP0015_1470 [Acinetobacter haemolyticus ATCC 19194]EPR89125.1 hypothetical protein L313_1651 [Acinetobacter haemolyticus CIP 64.3 = MTCC 9819]